MKQSKKQSNRQYDNVIRSSLLFVLLSLLILFTIAGFTGCDASGRTEKGPVSKVIVPQSKLVDQGASGLNGGGKDMGDPNSEELEPKIALSQNETLIQLVNTNLDLDGAAEQIIAVKDNRNPDNPIKIDVVDFDEIRNEYFLTWFDYIQATNPTALRIETDDLTGGFNMEIICRGMNTTGELTLDLFRKTTSQSGLKLSFYSILQVKANNKISIEKEKRDEAYQLRQNPGASYTVVVEKNDPESKSGFDLIREKYYWSYQEEKYIKLSVDKVPVNQIAQKQLKDVLPEGIPDKEALAFFRGVWYLQNQADVMVVFDPDYNYISFFNKNIIENYSIVNLYRFGYRFHFNTESTVIQSLKKWIEVNIKSPDAIDLAIRESESWNGAYERIAGGVDSNFLVRRKPTASPAKIELSGVYRNRENLEIAFEATPPYFTWLENGVSQGSGGYSIIGSVTMLNALFLEREVGKDVAVITFRYQKENGLFIKDVCYILEFTEKTENGTRNRLLTLTPARLLIRGVEAVDRKYLQLEQVEIVGTEKPEKR